MSRMAPIGSEAPAPAVEGEGLRIGGRCPNLAETCLILQACARQRPPPSESEVELIGRGRGLRPRRRALNGTTATPWKTGASGAGVRTGAATGAGMGRAMPGRRGVLGALSGGGGSDPPRVRFQTVSSLSHQPTPPGDTRTRRGKSAVTLHAPGGGATDAGDVLHQGPLVQPCDPVGAERRKMVELFKDPLGRPFSGLCR